MSPDTVSFPIKLTKSLVFFFWVFMFHLETHKFMSQLFTYKRRYCRILGCPIKIRNKWWKIKTNKQHHHFQGKTLRKNIIFAWRKANVFYGRLFHVFEGLQYKRRNFAREQLNFLEMEKGYICFCYYQSEKEIQHIVFTMTNCYSKLP